MVFGYWRREIAVKRHQRRWFWQVLRGEEWYLLPRAGVLS
jgi:hypothetical protein